MAVLSEPIEGTRISSGPLCVVAAAGAPTTQSRIAAALEGSFADVALLEAHTPGEAAELELGAKAILILVCDVDLPREMATLRRLRREVPGPAIVAVSPTATATGVRRALDAGADAIVFEPLLESTLAVTISAVGSGQSVVPREMRASVERPAFSHRERQVLTYVSQGLTNAQIADELFLSESTIKSHLSSAFAKFGVRSRREAAALFLELEQTTNGGPSGEGQELIPPTPRKA
ncbi:MAG: response regulator transcription factor [Solirubrobacterales bacterium]